MEFKYYHCSGGEAIPVNPYHRLHQIEWGVGKWETLPELILSVDYTDLLKTPPVK